jgi:hypothetical protein
VAQPVAIETQPGVEVWYRDGDGVDLLEQRVCSHDAESRSSRLFVRIADRANVACDGTSVSRLKY